MFSRDQVTIRPVDWPDRDRMYAWHCDPELEILSGWGQRRSKTGYEAKFRAECERLLRAKLQSAFRAFETVLLCC